ncbi:hypothetical protein CTI12_AA222750 [Artemisia annua]|uniref:Uncharacterized protein n=1 Tax=Artemisia annua TaxID=35608 RepID=A0A2U1MHN1_ARTAN|nr:hypothetical protein CTI12_AA222750 [Artemisia annua]
MQYSTPECNIDLSWSLVVDRATSLFFKKLKAAGLSPLLYSKGSITIFFSETAVIESSRPHVYTEKEIYEELQCMGLSKEDIQPAYAFLLEHPVQTRGLFGCPFEARGEFLKTVMGIDK